MKRRTFLKTLSAGAAISAFSGLGFDLSWAQAKAESFKLTAAKITTSVC